MVYFPTGCATRWCATDAAHHLVAHPVGPTSRRCWYWAWEAGLTCIMHTTREALRLTVQADIDASLPPRQFAFASW